jgi:Bacterial conjugation TrbI-like protein
MRRLIRFFLFGPGAILVIVGVVIGVCHIIQVGQEKERAEREKRQVQRPLGKVNPSDQVDKSQAPKEVVLSDRRLDYYGAAGSQATQTQLIAAPAPGQARALPQLVSFYSQLAAPSPSPSPVSAEAPHPRSWLPPGVFIPCALVNTVESSHIATPIVGEVLRNVSQNGHLIIPSGSVVSSFAQSGAVRDRIEVSGIWIVVYADGKHIKFHGIACDREADPANQQFGIEDGSAGLQGEIVESDHWANAKAFIALLMTSAMSGGQAIASNALAAEHTTSVVQVPDTTPVLAKYLDQLLNGETGDGRFVRVPASKEFYVFSTDTIEPAKRSIDEEVSVNDQHNSEQNLVPTGEDKILGQAVNMERAIQNAATEQLQNTSEKKPSFSY